MSVQKLAKRAVRVALVGGAGLALVTPSADARPVTDGPMHAAAPARQTVPSPSVQRHAPARQSRELMRDDLVPASGDVAASQTPAHHTSAATPQATTGGFGRATAAIGGVALVCVVGLIWLSAAAIGRITRTRVAS
jgi:hypothetical protein